jgi:hypothetical protein
MDLLLYALYYFGIVIISAFIVWRLSRRHGDRKILP